MSSIHEIEADIERTREELGETIDALGAKVAVRPRLAAHWQEIAVVAVTGALIVLAWKKL